MKFTLIRSPLLLALAATGLSACFDSNDKAPMMVSNSPPTTMSIALTTEADVAINDSLQATDVDGDSLTFSLVTEPQSGMLTLQADGSFVYQPAAEQTGTDSFSYEVSDGYNPAVSATVTITIEAQQVLVSTYTRQAFSQQESDTPLAVNGREFTQDVDSQASFDDLLAGQ
jgi:VCBS repeat-containing protein